MMQYLKRPGKPALAYVKTEAPGSALPMVVFCCGYRSDMAGTKATFLEDFCAQRGQPYLRFDYSGHGQSEGDFGGLCLSDWLADTRAMLSAHTDGPVILIGSSMGGWISLRVLEDTPDKVAGFIGIAAAPDFSREIESGLTAAQKQQLQDKGYVEEPNDYSDEPYRFTKLLIEDGHTHCLLHKKLSYRGPVRLLQGKQDRSVDWHRPAQIKAVLPYAEVAITLIEDGDHSLSRPQDLKILGKALESISG